MSNMQVYDIIILIIVGWLTLRGAMKGMVSQLASIAALIASIWAAIRFSPVLEPILQSNFNAQPPWDKVSAIVIVFVGASIAVMLVKRVLAGIINAIHLKQFDRLCGALFGFLKGVLIGMILTFFAVMLSEQTRTMATQSPSGQILVRLIQHSQSLLPDEVSALIAANLEGFQKQMGTADGAIGQIKTASDFKNAIEAAKNTVTQLTQRFSGSSDPADETPSLSDEIRKYPAPTTTYANYPPLPDNNTNATGTSASAVPARAEAIPNLQFDAGASTASGTRPQPVVSQFSSSPPIIIAPSADLQPMISPVTSSTPTPSETDWRVLMRKMR